MLVSNASTCGAVPDAIVHVISEIWPVELSAHLILSSAVAKATRHRRVMLVKLESISEYHQY